MKITKQLIMILVIILMSNSIFAQQTVSGTVKDKRGEPLPGASVVEKGTKNGTVTDFNGQYTIILQKEGAPLVFSYVGYLTKEKNTKGKKRVNVVLQEDNQKLDEVIVVGYGSTKRKDLTGSIASIKPKQSSAEQSQGVEELIKGRVAGVQVTANGSEPGSPASVRIRGLSSLTGNSEPLYVVDGIIMDSATEDVANPISGYAAPQGGISGINPMDIESIEILKDASATAIYGSRAANGVIIITTKKGKKGQTKFNFSSSFTIGSVSHNIEVLDTKAYVNYQNDVNAALGYDPKYIINGDEIFTNETPPVKITGINWAEDTYRHSELIKNRLSVSGGSKKGNYYISGGFLDNKGVFPNATAKSVDFNLNMNQKLSDRINLFTKVSTTYTKLSATKGTDAFGSTNHSMVKQVILAAPILNFKDNNIDSEDVDENIDGPRAWTQDYDDDANELRLLGSATMDYKLSKTFTYRLRFGGDYRKKERSFWYGNALLKGRNANGIAGVGTLNRFRYNVDNTLMFRKSFNKNNRINGTVGFLYDKKSVRSTTYSASDFADHSLRADGISYGSNYTPLYVSSEYPTILSFIGRVNYSLKNRYLFTTTFRADGSSKFAKGKRWGYFPAFSFAWKVHKEKFLKKIKTISNLKIRMGYGEVGNQNIQTYRYLTMFNLPNNGAGLLSDAAGGILIPLVSEDLANANLKWETSTQYNAGIDFGLFENKLSGTIDVYSKESKDLLYSVSIPPNTGYSKVIANQGDLVSKGLEISLTGKVLNNKNLNLDIMGNISFNKSEIANLGLINPKEMGSLGKVTAFLGNNISGGTYFKQPANIFIEGREPGLFYGLATHGIIRNNDDLISPATGAPLKYKGVDMRVGDVYFVDQNGDGVINEKDYTIIGNPNPDFVFGFGTAFKYKNLSINLMFNGVIGNDVANGNLFETGYANGTTKNTGVDAYYDAFDAVNNPDGNYPAVASDKLGADYTRDFNDRIIEDGSFLRLSNVSLGYKIPVKNLKLIKALRVTVSGQNLWLLTKYTGFDPEVNSFSFDPLRTGVDWGSFPNQRRFSLGINATF